MVALENGNVVLLGGHGHGYHVTMFDFEIEEWVNLANLTFYSDRYEPKSLCRSRAGSHFNETQYEIRAAFGPFCNIEKKIGQLLIAFFHVFIDKIF